MSQRAVKEFLEKHKGKWFTTKEIAKQIGITINSCSNNISRLRNYRMIKKRFSLELSNRPEYGR